MSEEQTIELTMEEKENLKFFFSNIKTSPTLKEKVKKVVYSYGEKSTGSTIIFTRPFAIAAVITFLIGFGMLLPLPFTKLPSLAQLYNTEEMEMVSNDLKELSKYIGFELNESHLLGFRKANFEVVGASKKKLIGKEVGIVFLKNDNGKKIAVCFLPKDYSVKDCHKIEVIGIPEYELWTAHKVNNEIEILKLPRRDSWTTFEASHNGTPFDCGIDEDCRFTSWKYDSMTLAIVGNDLSDLEIIDLVMPLRG